MTGRRQGPHPAGGEPGSHPLATVAAVVVPGPRPLGRSVVVGRGEEAPGPWAGAPRHRIDDEALADPEPMVAELHRAWLARQPVVVELACDPADLRAPETVGREPYWLDPGFELARERLQFLVWTNAYDARREVRRASDGEPVWWHGRRALRLGGQPGGPADLALADGTPVWCDGGPSQPLAPGDLGVSGACVVHRWSIEAGHLRPGRP
ncbi:MAG: hypothetical protein ACRD0J_16975, partial [Acidimicrobiales bacterium]